MYSKYSIILLFFIPVCIGCSNYPDKLPKDFSFELIGEVDSYSSDNGHFTRKAINEKFKDTTVICMLSQKDKEEIYKVFSDNNIFSIPKDFECSPNAQFMIPQSTTILKYEISGTKKEIRYNTGCFPKKNQNDEIRFDNITKFIRQKLNSKKSIRTIPKTKMRIM